MHVGIVLDDTGQFAFDCDINVIINGADITTGFKINIAWIRNIVGQDIDDGSNGIIKQIQDGSGRPQVDRVARLDLANY